MNKTLQSLVSGIINADKATRHDEIDVMLNFCMFNLKAPDKNDVDKLKPICDDVRNNGDNWTSSQWENQFNTMKEEVQPIAIIKYLVSAKKVEIDPSKIPSRTTKAFRSRYGFLYEDTIDNHNQ